MQETVNFAVARFKRKDLIAAWKVLSGDVKDDLTNFTVKGQVIELTGSPDAIGTARAWLVGNGFVSAQNSQAVNPPPLSDDLCSICFCEEEQPYHYRVCGHGGCSSCLTSQFSQAEMRTDVAVPIVCFSGECDHKLVALSDINALAPPRACAAIKEAAVMKFVRGHKNSVCICPAPECHQLLNLEAVSLPTSEDEEIALGGTACFCEECNRKVRPLERAYVMLLYI